MAKAWIKHKGRDVTKQETTDTGHGVNAFNEDPVMKVLTLPMCKVSTPKLDSRV